MNSTSNTILRNLRGIRSAQLVAPENAQVEMVKQDLPFVAPAATVQFSGATTDSAKPPSFPVTPCTIGSPSTRVPPVYRGTFRR